MKIKIKKNDCKFYVDEEKRVVVCVITGVSHLVNDFVEDIWNDDVNFDISYPLYKKLEMPNTFIGKAVCAAEDEWDVEMGKKIAYSRAKEKVYTSFFKRANLFAQTIDLRLNELVNRFNALGEAVSDNKAKLDSEIADYLKSIEEK